MRALTGRWGMTMATLEATIAATEGRRPPPDDGEQYIDATIILNDLRRDLRRLKRAVRINTILLLVVLILTLAPCISCPADQCCAPRCIKKSMIGGGRRHPPAGQGCLDMTPGEITSFIEGHAWRFARTMAHIPHSYVVKEKCRSALEFERFVVHIRRHGYRACAAKLTHLVRFPQVLCLTETSETLRHEH
jgi:hypothetical protein